jgi:hypothetical protein
MGPFSPAHRVGCDKGLPRLVDEGEYRFGCLITAVLETHV